MILPALLLTLDKYSSWRVGRVVLCLSKEHNKSRDNGGQFFFLLFFTVQ